MSQTKKKKKERERFWEDKIIARRHPIVKQTSMLPLPHKTEPPNNVSVCLHKPITLLIMFLIDVPQGSRKWFSKTDKKRKKKKERHKTK